ncbi:MAG: hypothetical protein KDD89_03065 [Anaerolineales bacterium]|nr:hypothetical protein [Anaerolineales bacterium]
MKVLPLTPADHRPWAGLLSLTTGQPYTTLRQQLASQSPQNTAVSWGAWDGASLVALFSARPMTINGVQHQADMRIALAQTPVIHPKYDQEALYQTVTQPVVESLRLQGTQALFQVERRPLWASFRQAPRGYHLLGQLRPYWGWLSQRPDAPPLHVLHHCPDQLPVLRPHQQITFMVDIDEVRKRYCAALDETYHFAVCQQNTAVTGLVVYKLSRHFGLPMAQLVAVYGAELEKLIPRWLTTMYDQGQRLIYTMTTPNAAVRPALRQHTQRLGERLSAERYLLYAQPLQRYVPANLLDLKQWNWVASDIALP